MRNLVLIIVLTLWSPSFVQAQSQDKGITQMLELTGLDELIRHIPKFAQDSLQQGKGSMDPKVWGLLNKQIPVAYDSEKINQDVYSYLNKNYDQKLARGYIEFLESDMAKKFSELEKGARENPQDFQNHVQTISHSFNQSPRGKAIGRLDNATRTSEFSIDLQVSFFRTIFEAVDPYLESDMKLQNGELEKMTGEVRSSLTAPTENMTLYSYSYAFKDISEQSLEEFIAAYEKTAPQWAIKTMGKAVIYALEQARVRTIDLMKPPRLAK